MIYKTIYGEMVEGNIISRRRNVAIVETKDRNRHMVHNSDIGEMTGGKHDTWLSGKGFDLAECQRKGRTGRAAAGRNW